VQDILILNAGSSSVKFALLPVATWWTGARLRGQIEGLGGDVTFRVVGRNGALVHSQNLARKNAPKDPALALDHLFDWLLAVEPSLAIGAIGHRVVHGGSRFSAPVVVDDETLAALAVLEPLAPLHQPYNVAGIRAARKRFPDALQVACFDTAFHRTIPWENEAFALPHALYDEGVRRYGFHGLSYEYVTRALNKLAPEAAAGRVVVAHLGNGASMCAVENGRSVASTMGFSTLDGLPMGTRCGALDPGVLLYLMTERGMDVQALTRLLYRDSGLKGLSGVSHDLRALDASADPQAAAAIRYFVAQICREVGALTAQLGGLDALVFTAGIGEHSASVRAAVCERLDWLGLGIDCTLNTQNAMEITGPGSCVRVFCIPTNEEAVIARYSLGEFACAQADRLERRAAPARAARELETT
jgi:acetate kinase